MRASVPLVTSACVCATGTLLLVQLRRGSMQLDATDFENLYCHMFVDSYRMLLGFDHGMLQVCLYDWAGDNCVCDDVIMILLRALM